MVNPEYLKMFALSHELGSFSACARRMGKGQSAISQGIANLEVDLNVTLFDRSTRKPTLTEQGEQLLQYALSVLRQNQEFEFAVQALHKQQEAQVTFALDSGLFVPKLSQILLAFSQQFRSTQLNLLTMPSTQITDKVARHEVDIGLMFADPSFVREVELGYIGSVPLSCVCSPQHPLAEFDQVGLAELMPHRQLLAQRHSDEMPPIGPEFWLVENFNQQKQLLLAGLGWAYLPAHLVQGEIDKGELNQLALTFDHKPWIQAVDCITPKNAVKGPALNWLYQQLIHLLDD